MTRFDPHRAAVWGAAPAVLAGLILAAIGFLAAPWPSDSVITVGVRQVSFFERLRGLTGDPAIDGLASMTEKPATWTARRMLDGLGAVGLAVGAAGLVAALRYMDRSALAVVAMVGALGALYTAWVGFALGSFLAMAGFGLMLFGAGLSWASDTTSDSRRTSMPIEHVAQTGTGLG